MKTVRIGDLVEKVATWNPRNEAKGELIRYVDISSVSQTEKIVTVPEPIPGGDAPSRARQLVRTGDIIVSTVRPNLNAVATIPEELDGATASTGFSILRAQRKKLSSAYLFHWVRSPTFVSTMMQQASGQSYPAVSDRIVKSSEILLPPLEEQRRIAAILDQADALRRLRRRALDRLNALGQAIFHEMFGEFLAVAPLSELTLKITDGTHQAPEWAESGIPFIFVSNVRRQLIDTKTDRYVTEREYRQLLRRANISSGDVVYTCVGSYGNAAVVMKNERFVFQRHIAHIKPNPKIIDSMFLSYGLESPRLRAQADIAATGIAQKTVTLKALKNFSFPAPPLEEQLVFRERVELVRKMVDVAEVDANKQDSLFASLQHRAFRGEL